jgi:hypothetical protein
VRHARSRDLDQLEDLLDRLRAVEGLTERRHGVFYRGSTAFLHFHQDRAGLFADLKVGGGWLRYPVSSAPGQRTLVADTRRVLRGEKTDLRGSTLLTRP